MDWEINLNAKMMTIVFTKLSQISAIWGVFVKRIELRKKSGWAISREIRVFGRTVGNTGKYRFCI